MTDSLGSSSPEPQQSTTVDGPSTGRRFKTGCLTCRLRKKKCDEERPCCTACVRLGLECNGFGESRPRWIKQQVQDVKARTKRQRRFHSTSMLTPDEEANQRMAMTHRHDPLVETMRSGIDSTSRKSLSPSEANMVQTTSTTAEWFRETDSIPGSSNYQATTSLPITTRSNISNNDFFSLLFGPDALVPLPLASPTGTLDLTSSIPTLEDPVDFIQSLTGFDNLPLSMTPPSPEVLPGVIVSDHRTFQEGSILYDNPMRPLLPPSDAIDGRYLHHYLNIVLPLQYRFSVPGMSNYLAPMACNIPSVLNAASALAALHLVSCRFKLGPPLGNQDMLFANRACKQMIDGLRNIPSDACKNEDVAVVALLATSFYLFSGGTDKGWRETVAICQRSLEALLSGPSRLETINWKRNSSLIPTLIWTDVLSSVTENRSSRLLPVYRILFDFKGDADDERLLMETVMGCDSTTFLAIAETVSLSEWRETQVKCRSLSSRDLLDRARPIEKLFSDREWREPRLFRLDEDEGFDKTKQRLTSAVFCCGAQVLLATTIDGPFPNVPDIARKVSQTITAVVNLESHLRAAEGTFVYDLSRALVFPITIAGCHAAVSQQQFFRDRFRALSPEALAYGNTGSALRLMEGVWKQREHDESVSGVCWRAVMKDLGWEAGLLLI